MADHHRLDYPVEVDDVISIVSDYWASLLQQKEGAATGGENIPLLNPAMNADMTLAVGDEITAEAIWRNREVTQAAAELFDSFVKLVARVTKARQKAGAENPEAFELDAQLTYQSKSRDDEVTETLLFWLEEVEANKDSVVMFDSEDRPVGWREVYGE